MGKFRCPNEKEQEIIARNGIDLDKTSMVVEHSTETEIHLLNHKTRDRVVIYQGDKKW